MSNSTFISSALRQFRLYKSLGDRSLSRLSEAQLRFVPAPESNSAAVIVRHLHGNMLSRWTDFLTSDGEKPWRKRDEEFEPGEDSRGQLMKKWEDGWTCLFNALEKLNETDLTRTVTIRAEKMSATEAIHRQIAHYSYHVGQIVYIAKMLSGEKWESLSIPKKRSD